MGTFLEISVVHHSSAEQPDAVDSLYVNLADNSFNVFPTVMRLFCSYHLSNTEDIVVLQEWLQLFRWPMNNGAHYISEKVSLPRIYLYFTE